MANPYEMMPVSETAKETPEQFLETTAEQGIAALQAEGQDATLREQLEQQSEPVEYLAKHFAEQLEPFLAAYAAALQAELPSFSNVVPGREGEEEAPNEFRVLSKELLEKFFHTFVFDYCGPLLGIEEAHLQELPIAELYAAALKEITHNRLELELFGSAVANGELVHQEAIGETAKNITDQAREIGKLAANHGVPQNRAFEVQLAVGEAGTNAKKHGEGIGEVAVYEDETKILVKVTDHGEGITLKNLPAAVLLPGYSGTASLGMGLGIMLDCADHLRISSRPGETSFSMEFSRAA